MTPRVLIVHNNYQQPGGEKTAVEAQIRLLKERGHEVLLYERDNTALTEYNALQKALTIPQTVFSWETYREVRQLARQERPDVAHVHNVFPLISPAVYRALHDEGVPIVQTAHNYRFLCPNSLFHTHGQICERCKSGNTLNAVRLRCYRGGVLPSALYALAIGGHRQWGTFGLIDRIIAPTEFTATKLVESGLVEQNKVIVLANSIANPLPEMGSFEERQPYVTYLGRFTPEKGIGTLIRAVGGVPGLGLKILGDGPEAPEWQALARECGDARVEFLGFVRGAQKWQILREGMATVVPSEWYEPFGLVAVESMAVGTPVVAAKIGGLRYVVQDGESGWHFQPGDVVDLRTKLHQLMEQPEKALAMGRVGRKAVEQRFTAAVHYEGLMRVYEDVTGC